MLDIYIDADACPVKEETYKVAARYQLKVWVVANSGMKIPFDPRIQLEVVSGGFDAADDWIIDHLLAGDIVVTTDILLAQRALGRKARALNPKGTNLPRTILARPSADARFRTTCA